MAMEKIDFAKAKTIAEKKGLKPGKVKGTEGIQFTKGSNNRLDVISWDEFKAVMARQSATPNALLKSRGSRPYSSKT